MGGFVVVIVLALLVIIIVAKTAVVVPQQSAFVVERLGKVMISPVVSTGSGTIVRRASGTVRAGRDVLFVLEV